MASTMASSSRVVLEALTSIASRRTVVHHARPVRQPILRSPQTPKERSPTPGTSYPNLDPSSSKTASQVRSTQLQGTNYTLHHSPPPSAPSYTTGAMPPFMQWCQGNSISLNSERGARLRRERKAEIAGGLGWDEEMLGKMKELRAQGLSRRKIGEALSIPFEHHHLIARAAPQSADQAIAQEQRLNDLKSTWGYKKRLARDMRMKRKDFW